LSKRLARPWLHIWKMLPAREMGISPWLSLIDNAYTHLG
jgi:hypothetical protein